jgi:signal transduction histidine kinase
MTTQAVSNPFRADTTPASAILSALEHMFTDDAEAEGIRLKILQSSVIIKGDAMAALRCLSNFVSNAIRHSESDTVLVGCRRRGHDLRFEVHDRGKGIEADRLNQIIQPTQNGADLSDHPDGHGLGLSIAWTIAEHQGYRADSRSVPGKGSCFSLIVPRAGNLASERDRQTQTRAV